MKQQSYFSTFVSRKKHNSDSLFRGIWLRWELLTQAEKVVCLGILLIPLWWCIGWSVILLLWVVGIAAYELFSYKTIRLSRPSLEVIAIIIFSFYRAMTYVINSPDITPRGLIDPFLMWGCGGLLLWYIQTHKIRVRLQVVAWACSVIIALMTVMWLFIHFVLGEPYYNPTRTLFASLTDKGTRFIEGQAGSVANYLAPYDVTEKGFAGLSRFTFFFPHSTISSFFIGFAGLIILDTKKFWWSVVMTLDCVFLIFICQTRNAWLVMPIVLLVGWLIKTGNKGGFAFILMLLATISFTTLSLPSITDYIGDTYTNTVEATSNFRKASTEDRQKIYQRTWESIMEEPFLGHGVNGPSVTPGYDFAKIGTESFILGTLLYKSGFLGTGVFITFLIPLIAWLYKTSEERPLSSFLMLLYIGLTSIVSELQVTEVFLVLLCIVLRDSYPLKQYV
jgi:hypothetical protein